ncbi:hypothetical protein [Streptosporangium roseum]|uniref:hypothetical protein n=1 Tax=Streptosporangium roseum TaxID=2001 RepID=UPI00331CB79A
MRVYVLADLGYSRGTDRTWVYGALRIRDGTELAFCASSRNSDGWIQLPARIAKADRRGPIVVITQLNTHAHPWIRG